jgi:hypothetical protein
LADKFQYIYADPIINGIGACETGSDGSYTSVPYGTYNSDTTFCSESIDTCKWVARRLGHPVMQLEFNSGSLYAMFEEAVTEYSQHINNYNIRNWMWNQYSNDDKSISGSVTPTSTNPVTPNMGLAVGLSEQYGVAANVGGGVTLYSASIALNEDQQEYDLQSAFDASSTVVGTSNVGKRIEVQRVFNYGPDAITRFYDPYLGSFDERVMLDQFGFGEMSPASTFVLAPIYYDVLRSQAIETSDRIRRSNYSFEIVNNKVKIFPRPSSNDVGNKIWFEYYIRDEKTATSRSYTEGKITDPSNAPYEYIVYNEINGPGRQWIKKYALALSKELLGIIRSKYGSLPLPNGDVSMDGEALKAEGREEKTQLLEELKEFLETMSLTEKSKAEAEEAEAQQQVLNKAPLGIYIG